MRAGHRLVAAALVAGLAATACGGNSAPVASAGEVRAAVGRSTGSVDTGPLVAGLTRFGHDLLAEVAAPGQNAVVSPLSVAVAVSMARVGARGQTAAQIDRVLHFPAARRDAAFNTLTRAVVTSTGAPPPRPQATRSPGAPPAPPVVTLVNALFAQAGAHLRQQFLRTLAADYGAGVRTVDFGSPSATDTINAWVRQQTADRIQRLFDSLDPQTRLVIANAVYLKADWAQPFAKDPTTDDDFRLADGSSVRVPTMHQQGGFRYAAGPGWQAVELPYAGERLAMWLLVPTGRGRPDALLAPTTLEAVAAGLQPRPVDLAMPRWDFGTDVDLVPTLERLGLSLPFSGAADFSGIAPGLFVSQAVHRANITVDEWGTEAAAVTGLAIGTSAQVPPTTVVHADHPFAFAVVDRPTGAPLFIGTVADPRQH